MTNARATQIAVIVLEAYEPQLTFDCQLWLITRRDGVEFGYTSHDEDITYLDQVYQSCKSLQASAIETGAFMDATGNLDLLGMITDDRITERDLFGGLFDGARIDIWRYYWRGQNRAVKLTSGLAGKVTQNDQEFTLEALTDRARLDQQALLEPITPSCRFNLGDARCQKDISALIRAGAVTDLGNGSAYPSSARRVFGDSSRGEADAYWALGELTWTSGGNAGLSSEIKDFTDSGFILWDPMPFPIAIGDAYSVKPGCDRLKATCIGKFDNYINYGGFADVPGKDALMQTPEAKQ
jgi:uncharacterized phage protein (TIGR02218 family)